MCLTQCYIILTEQKRFKYYVCGTKNQHFMRYNEEGYEHHNKSYRGFRTSLDFGMGGLYIIIGALVLWARYFGTMQLSATYAYILGGAMVLYGAFRIYRGASAMIKMRRERNEHR